MNSPIKALTFGFSFCSCCSLPSTEEALSLFASNLDKIPEARRIFLEKSA